MRIDLHTHSTASDGTQSPAEVMEAAVEAGLTTVALTDHDTTAGWGPARRRAEELGLDFVPGMEVSCSSSSGISVHLLCYLQDPLAPGLMEEIGRSRAARMDRARRMVERIAEDYPIDWEAVLSQVRADATVGRPHIADALVAAGVCGDRSEAFATILRPSTGYYIPHYAPDPADAVRLVREAGGVPVFAHPLASARGRVVSEDVFDEMVEAGLAGLEVRHRDNPPEAQAWLMDYAARHELIVTGSSDYHGAGKPNRLGENTTSPEALEAIRAQARPAG
ncbi:PHP domain-containing protein [Rothia halotolerans]|uniref:PHP domain-containing protein n=1 Tax=Rothia halotolerans TaxID=405770 RepID=UPI00101D172A|nr:PHP domain-containing protein [Rothia halotolerans]